MNFHLWHCADYSYQLELINTPSVATNAISSYPPPPHWRYRAPHQAPYPQRYGSHVSDMVPPPLGFQYISINVCAFDLGQNKAGPVAFSSKVQWQKQFAKRPLSCEPHCICTSTKFKVMCDSLVKSNAATTFCTSEVVLQYIES